MTWAKHREGLELTCPDPRAAGRALRLLRSSVRHRDFLRGLGLSVTSHGQSES